MPGAEAPRARDLSVLALAALAPIWGYGWIVTKVALGDAPPFRFAALRAALSAAMLFGVMLLARRSLRPPPLRWVSSRAVGRMSMPPTG